MLRSFGAIRRITACSRSSSRSLGGGGHGHGHAHVKQPYDAWHPPSRYGEVAYPFGIAPGTPKEGWEIPTMITYVAVLGLFLYGSFGQSDNPSPLVINYFLLSKFILISAYFTGMGKTRSCSSQKSFGKRWWCEIRKVLSICRICHERTNSSAGDNIGGP